MNKGTKFRSRISALIAHLVFFAREFEKNKKLNELIYCEKEKTFVCVCLWSYRHHHNHNTIAIVSCKNDFMRYSSRFNAVYKVRLFSQYIHIHFWTWLNSRMPIQYALDSSQFAHSYVKLHAIQ